MKVTLTIRRFDEDVTVEVVSARDGGRYLGRDVELRAVDERGKEVELTNEELIEVLYRAESGEDETGR